MKHIGTSVDKFFRVRSSRLRYRRRQNDASRQECMSNDYVATDPRWQIGMHGGITQEEVKVIGAIHVSAGSWMPIIQLTRYVV